MYEEVPWAIDAYDLEFPDRLRAFLLTKYSTIDRAIEHLQVSSSAMYSYLRGEKRREGGEKLTYPSVPFLLKLAMMGCNLHWLLTGNGEMNTDIADIGLRNNVELRRRSMAIIAKYDLKTPEELETALDTLVALTAVRRILIGEVGLKYRVDQKAEGPEITAEAKGAKRNQKRTNKPTE